MGLKTIEGDEAFYFLNKGGSLKGAVLTHVEDFTLAGTEDFLRMILDGIKKCMCVSKVERNVFRFTGLDIKKKSDGISISMDDYVESLQEVKEIRKASGTELLTKLEMKQYRKMIGKINWLAQSTRPDLCYTGLSMAKRNNAATIADLAELERPSHVIFSKIGIKEKLEVVGIGDASYKCDEKSIGGNMIFIKEADSDRASLIYWKTKQIDRVTHSSKDAETLNVSKLVDDAVFLARQLEILLFGDYKGRILVKLFTDSEPTLESIASSKQVERKLLRMTIKDLKDRLLEGDVSSYSWLSTRDMMADCMTKEMKMPESLEDVLLENKLTLNKPYMNEVRNVDGEIRMMNIRNRKKVEMVDQDDQERQQGAHF